jgi:hypothetical protein
MLDKSAEYTGVTWDMYNEQAVPAARAQRLLLDVIQSEPRQLVVSYSLDRFLIPWVMTAPWAQSLLQYTLADYQALVYALDTKTLPKALTMSTLHDMLDFVTKSTSSMRKGYSVDALITRYGHLPSGQIPCLDKNIGLRAAFRQFAGAQLC